MAHWSIIKKVTISFAFLGILIGSLGFLSFQALSLQRKASIEISEIWLPNVSKSDEINLNITKFRMAQLDYLVVQDTDARAAIKSQFEEFNQNLFIYRKVYEPLIQGADQQKLYDQFSESWDKYIEAHDQLIAVIDAGKTEEAGELISTTEQLFLELSQKMTQLSNHSYESGVEASKKAGQTFETVKWISMGLSGFSLLAVFVVGYFTRREVRMRLGPIARSTAHSSELIKESVGLLADSSRQLSERSSESAASLEETVASMEELTAAVKLNTDSAIAAAELSQQSQESVGQGQKNIQLMIENMKEVAEASKKINDILVLIEDISFQTNLLALNAAVEAARAGEQGKGFAVVADAVRALAQKSAESAKEISGLVHASAEKTERGVKLATDSEKSLETIVASVTKVTALVQDIAKAAQEQNIGISQTGQTLSQIDQAIQGNAANTQTISDSSFGLQEQAETLSQMARELRAFSGVQDEPTRKWRLFFWKKKKEENLEITDYRKAS